MAGTMLSEVKAMNSIKHKYKHKITGAQKIFDIEKLESKNSNCYKKLKKRSFLVYLSRKCFRAEVVLDLSFKSKRRQMIIIP